MVNNQEWYSNALEVLSPLRYHLNEVLLEIECHNRLAERLNQVKIPPRRIEEAKKALEIAEQFFTKQQEQLGNHDTKSTA